MVMKYKLVLLGRFKRDLKAAKKRGLNISLLDAVVDKLLQGILLDKKYQDHALKGKWDEFRECHIQPDWLLMYLVEDGILTLTLVDTGTHVDLLKK